LNQVLIGWGVSLLLFIGGVGIPSGKAYSPQSTNPTTPPKQTATKPVMTKSIDNFESKTSIATPKIKFTWGDVSWLPELATEAGWPKDTHEKLAEIILRESGGCPNRRGGDAVDKNCNITHVTEWNHRSDSGLLQINGVNYNPKRNKWAIACRKLNICTQEPLLDALTNLKVGYLLYEADGWNPWDPCAWGEKYAKRCKNKP